MKYNIIINQAKAIEWGLNLTEAAIFSFLYELPSWAVSGIERTGDLSPWYFCSKNKIIDEFPLLTNKRDTVYRLLKKLEEKGLIVTKFDGGKDWIQITEKGQTYNDWKNSEKNPTSEKFPIPNGKTFRNRPEKNPTNNTSIIPCIKDTGPDEPASLKKEEIKEKTPEQKMYERKVRFLKLVIDWVAENPGKYPKQMYVDFAKYWVENSVLKTKIKLRFEDQQYFDVGRRLSTWFQKVKDIDLQKMWDQEKTTASLNDLFKTQILKINATKTDTEKTTA